MLHVSGQDGRLAVHNDHEGPSANHFEGVDKNEHGGVMAAVDHAFCERTGRRRHREGNGQRRVQGLGLIGKISREFFWGFVDVLIGEAHIMEKIEELGAGRVTSLNRRRHRDLSVLQPGALAMIEDFLEGHDQMEGAHGGSAYATGHKRDQVEQTSIKQEEEQAVT